MADTDDRARVHDWVRRRMLPSAGTGADTGGGIPGPAPACAASARGAERTVLVPAGYIVVDRPPDLHPELRR